MAAISANMVKDLREKTGAGMMECKKALADADGNVDAAVKLLRERGIAKGEKRAARHAAEGLVEITANADNTAAAMVELNCETDFVARNEDFQAVVKALASAALAGKAGDVDTLNGLPLEGYGKPAGEVVADLLARIGEKIEISRVAYLEADHIATYIHPPGKIGVLAALGTEGAKLDESLAAEIRNLAMHIAAAAPRFLTRDEVDEATLDNERDIFAALARKEGKPDEIIPKIVEGKIASFYKDNCLVDQIHVVDGKQSVSKVLDAAAKAAGGKVVIKSFVRFQVGETAAGTTPDEG